MNISVGTLSFLLLVLFMVHEFEETVFARYWVDEHRTDPAFKSELWVRQYITNRPATLPAFDCMVGEEFALAALILLGAIVFNSFELVIALFLTNMLHLCVHLLGAWRIRKWSPGSVTALLTLLPSVWLVWSTFSFDRLNVSATVLTTLGFLAFFTVNGFLLKRSTPKIEHAIAAYVKHFY